MPPSPTAPVAGASRGIGKETALELARHHYRVAVNYYNESPSNRPSPRQFRECSPTALGG
jgi:NAD(P)-dependent dehydrogenase (short-subunit alcohol dehydrogenase family)